MAKILAVGDIHAKPWIIDEIAKLVNDYDCIVFCGDYVDNFHTSPAVSIETWYALKKLADEHENVHPLIGNHDYAYLHAEIAGRSSGWNHVTFTLLNAPENKELREWLLTLPPVIQIDDIAFSHAGVTEDWDGSLDVNGMWNDISPIWARPIAWGGSSRYREIPQVIGHNPSETIWNPQEGIWCIDTFSENYDNEPIGDYTALEIDNGEYKKIQIKNNSSSTSIEDSIS